MHSWGDAAAPLWYWPGPLGSEARKGKVSKMSFPQSTLDAGPHVLPKRGCQDLPGPSPRPLSWDPRKAGPHQGGGHWNVIGGTVEGDGLEAVDMSLAQTLCMCSSTECTGKHPSQAPAPGLWQAEPGEEVRRAREQGSCCLPELHSRRDPGSLCNELIAPAEWVQWCPHPQRCDPSFW